MRSVLLTLIGIGMLIWNVSAQDQAGQAKYELIRETINFLATDHVVSRDTNFRISCETLDYDCFRQQLSSQPIAGIERWYNSWRSMTATDKAGLATLRNQVFADIFERQGKGYRKQLVSYQGYISRVEHLVDQFPDGMPIQENAMDIFSDTALAPPDNRTGLHSTNPEQRSDRNDNPEKDTMIAYFALAMSIIALIMAALLIFRKGDRQMPAEFQGLPERLDELSMRMKRLERQATDPQIKDAITSLTDIMESVEKRVVELENRSSSTTR